MPKIRPRTLITVLLHALLLITLYFFQAAVFPYLPLFGVKPLILPVAVVGVALLEGVVSGGMFGLFAGILCDVSLNQPAIECTVILTVVGLAVGILSETVLAHGFPSYVFAAACSLFALALCQMFGLFVYSGVSFLPLLTTALRQTLYSLFFTLPLYYLVRLVGYTSRSS